MAKHGHSVRMSDGTWSVASAEPTTPEFSEFIAEALAYTKVYKSKGGSGVGGDISGFLQTRLEAIQNVIGQHLGSENLLNIGDLYDNHKVVHLDVSGMDPANRKIIETLFHARVMQHQQTTRIKAGDEDMPFDHAMVIEEAQSLLEAVTPDSPQEKMAKVWEGNARQARGYGLGMIYLVQEPERLLPSILSQASTRIIGRLLSAASRDAVLSATGMEQGSPEYNMVSKLISRFSPGQVAVRRGTDPFPMLVKMPKPQKPVKGSGAHRNFSVLNGFRSPDGGPYTQNEIDAAEQRLLRKEGAELYAHATADTLARMLNKDLPKMSDVLRRQLNEDMTRRQRDLALQVAARHMVNLRARGLHGDTGPLKAAVTIDLLMSSRNINIAGHKPGTRLTELAPEANQALALQELTNPYIGRSRDPGTRVAMPQVPGLRDAILASRGESAGQQGETVLLPRAAEAVRMLGRLPFAVNSELEGAQDAKGRGVLQLLGSDGGKGLDRATLWLTNHEPNAPKRWRLVSVMNGLEGPGDPDPSWFVKSRVVPKRTILSKQAAAPTPPKQAAPPGSVATAGPTPCRSDAPAETSYPTSTRTAATTASRRRSRTTSAGKASRAATGRRSTASGADSRQSCP